ncbi:MAG TPA: MmgE/PrpD family protein, partial [Burkholderiales bacterium]|nr:MmgE/PrpD family protein [Burkholderiales bacterium]
GTRRARPARTAAAASREEGSAGTTTRFFDGQAASHGSAAFANAVLLSGRVQGDSHPCGHIGGVVIPATLASAERAGIGGKHMLASLIAAYEVALRIGRDHAADLSLRGFRTTPCYGVFGAAVAAGRAQRFDAGRMASAIGLAANFAGGLREYVDAGTEESPFQAGFAARNGLYTADLVAQGLIAAPSALHGSSGFYRAFAEPGIDYGKRLTEDLGTQFEFINVTYKEYPACQFLRGVIRGLAELGKQAVGAKPAFIEVTMNPYEADFIGVRYTGPYTSATQTVMSAPFCSALAWTTGTASFDGLRRFDAPDVLDLIPRIAIVSDPARARYEPVMRVTLANGSVLEWVEKAGDSGYRVDWKAAVKMTRQLCDEVAVPERLATTLIDVVSSIDDEGSVAPLIAAVCAATTA